MLAFFFFLLSEATHSASGGESFWSKYMNYPGFEAWKFINLAIFVGGFIYIIRKPLTEAFKAKREQIRAELIKAEEEKQAAMAQLTATEAKLARLDNEKAAVLTRAKNEAELEEKRIAEETDNEVKKLRDQANNEISRTAALAKQELRKLSAEETIRRAEELIKANLSNGDSDLVKTGIASLANAGGAK